MSNVSVTTTATKIVGANSNRVSIIIENEGSSDVYIGSSNLVTAANGVKIVVEGTFTEDAGGTPVYKGDIWGITSTGTADVRYWERGGNI